MSVVIETTLGDIIVDLYTEERPQICKNFLKLCKLKYYNHCLFHFIQSDFIAQTGDPTGTGNGGESVWVNVHGQKARFFQTERNPKIKHDRAGLISMVNNGENLHGSQFFFTLSHTLDYLDNVHCVFGEVAEGMDVIIKLNDVICDEKNRPYQDILISHTVILDDPFPEIEGLQLPDKSPEYDFEDLLKTDRIGVGEELFDDDKPPELIEEENKDKEAKQQALVLEMIGDLPDADCAPPENVLFICKLNPITTEEDLEIIFSRFGKIISCEIIKDDKTGDSLQYGFIEFDNKDDCEKAYFKMDNVLIDDRRIHVDFSQSVSKIRWKGKGRVQFQDDKGNWSNSKQNYNDPKNGKKSTDKYKANQSNFQKHKRKSLTPEIKYRERSRSPSDRRKREYSPRRYDDKDRKYTRNIDDHGISKKNHDKNYHEKDSYRDKHKDNRRKRSRSRSKERSNRRSRSPIRSGRDKNRDHRSSYRY